MVRSPRSPVRMRTASSTGRMKILPSPISPVRAAAAIASTTASTLESTTTASTFTFRCREMWTRVPRYISV